MFLFIVAVICGWVSVSAEPQLIQVQSIWRHGDRTPLSSYKNDPYQQSFWGVPWGTLTTIGMEQHFEMGQKLRRRYVEEYKLLNGSYVPGEIYVRSADTERCTQSAESNLAAFFANSGFHPSNSGWPSGWTPVPIHTVPKAMDHELEPGHGCIRVDVLLAERVAHKEFIEYEVKNANVFAEIISNSGDKITDVTGLIDFFDIIECEKQHNLTLPAWITPDFYDKCTRLMNETLDFVYGMPGFGQGEDTEMLRLRGGPLISLLVSNMKNTTSQTKYHIFSAHDMTLSAILYALGAKSAALGTANPPYSSTLVFELWKLDDGSLNVKVVFTKNAADTWHTITSSISGCPLNDLCPLTNFISRNEKYIPHDIEKECL